MSRWPRVVVAFLAGVAILRAPATAQTPTSPPPPAATPAAPASAAVRTLQRDLHDVLRAPGWSDARFAALVVSLDRGDTLFSLNPDRPLAPASNMKLFSTAAALHFLGPDYRFATLLLADGPIRNGALEGDLILYGTGDPALSGRLLPSATGPLRELADTLAALGVREIRGDLVGDGSYLPGAWTGAGWNPADLDAWYGAPNAALSLAENLVTLTVAPGAAGGPARLRTEPDTRGLAVENRVRTVADGTTGVRIVRAADRLIVEGQIRQGGAAVTRTLPVVDPVNYAAAALRSLLEARGIAVRGAVRGVRDPARSRVSLAAATPRPTDRLPPRVVALHLSPTMKALARVTNHVSHNLFADAMLRAAGRAAVGDGTFEGGERALRHMLERLAGEGVAGFRAVDGSGLSSLNRASPRAVVHLLAAMAASSAWEPYRESLPEAGSARGLRRMYGTAAAGNLRAKTGTIRGVSALSGYVRAADGERLVFSILANGVPSTTRQKRSEDAIGARLAAFRRE